MCSKLLAQSLMLSQYSIHNCQMNELNTPLAGNLNTYWGNQQLILKLGLTDKIPMKINVMWSLVPFVLDSQLYASGSYIPELSWCLLLNVSILQLFDAQVKRSLILVKLLNLWIMDVCRLSFVLLKQRINNASRDLSLYISIIQMV